MPSESTEDIANKIIELAKDRRQSGSMGQRARKHAEETFGVETHIQKVQNIYQKTVKGLKFLTDLTYNSSIISLRGV